MRMQRDVGLAESVSEADQVTEVAREPVESPDQDVVDVAVIDHP